METMNIVQVVKKPLSKVCTKCGKEKKLTEYYQKKSIRGKLFHESYCKDCKSKDYKIAYMVKKYGARVLGQFNTIYSKTVFYMVVLYDDNFDSYTCTASTSNTYILHRDFFKWLGYQTVEVVQISLEEFNLIHGFGEDEFGRKINKEHEIPHLHVERIVDKYALFAILQEFVVRVGRYWNDGKEAGITKRSWKVRPRKARRVIDK